MCPPSAEADMIAPGPVAICLNPVGVTRLRRCAVHVPSLLDHQLLTARVLPEPTVPAIQRPYQTWFSQSVR